MNMTSDIKVKKFYEKVKHNGDCHEWIGSLDPDGYGNCWMLGQRRAHRVSFVLHKGPIPKGAFVCHTCDLPKCVNPKHLFLGTALTNNQDREQKGRGGQWKRMGVFKKYCNKGHEYTEENTYKNIKTGKRQCKECGRIKALAFYNKNKEKCSAEVLARYHKTKKLKRTITKQAEQVFGKKG